MEKFNHSKQSLLSNPKEFEAYLEEIDQKLILSDIKIQSRPIMAGREISIDLNCNISWEEEFHKKIIDWYEKKYGSRLLNDFAIGKIVVLIKNIPFLVKFPLIYGTYKVKPLEFIQGITPYLINSLSKEEIDYLFNFILKNFNAYNLIHEYEFISIIMPDTDNAINQIMNQNPAYGQSKWASLQVAEKALKKYIFKKGGKIEKIHILSKLANQAESLGLPKIPIDLINKIQCNAGIRYGEEKVSLNEAVEAHQLSIELCELIVTCPNFNQNT